MIDKKKEKLIMKKTLVALFTLVALAVGIQVTQAACPCANPCPCAAPCAAPCPAAPACATPCCNSCCDCCDNGACRPKCKCTWWKIFEDKTCCYKCNNECNSCLTAKRAHWWKIWTDRCVVKNAKCDDCKCPCN